MRQYTLFLAEASLCVRKANTALTDARAKWSAASSGLRVPHLSDPIDASREHTKARATRPCKATQMLSDRLQLRFCPSYCGTIDSFWIYQFFRKILEISQCEGGMKKETAILPKAAIVY